MPLYHLIIKQSQLVGTPEESSAFLPPLGALGRKPFIFSIMYGENRNPNISHYVSVIVPQPQPHPELTQCNPTSHMRSVPQPQPHPGLWLQCRAQLAAGQDVLPQPRRCCGSLCPPSTAGRCSRAKGDTTLICEPAPATSHQGENVGLGK